MMTSSELDFMNYVDLHITCIEKFFALAEKSENGAVSVSDIRAAWGTSVGVWNYLVDFDGGAWELCAVGMFRKTEHADDYLAFIKRERENAWVGA